MLVLIVVPASHLGVFVECLLLLLLSLVAEFPHHRQQPLVLLLQILYVPEGGGQVPFLHSCQQSHDGYMI